MSTNATAAAIGIKITADPKPAEKSIAELEKKIGSFGKKPGRYATELDELRGLAGKGVDGLEKLTWGFGRASVSAAKFGVGLGAVAATAAAVGFVDMGVQFATAGAVVGRVAGRLGVPVEKLSQLQIAAKLAGSSAEDMTGSLQGLQDTVNSAANGQNNEAFAEFKAAGINIGGATNAAKNWLTVLPKIADEYQRLAKRNPHAALMFLDKVGVSRDLSPLLQNGAAGLKDYLDQAQRFGPLTAEDAARARELEKTLAGLGLTWNRFGREAGSSIAPALTSSLGELEKFLADHKEDVGQFFHDVEKGLEWIVKPQGRAWIRQELDDITDGVKHLYQFALDVEQTPIVRRLLGLPVDPATTESKTPIGNGIPMEDDGGRLNRALEAAPSNGPGMFRQMWNWATGSRNHPAAKLSPELEKLSDAEAAGQGVSPAFARTIFGIEHGLNTDGTPAISPAGAVGAGQLMPATARDMGVTDPRDLGQNVHGSVAYMKKMLTQFAGNELVAAAAYNAGPNNPGVAYFAQTGDPSHLPAETQAYVRMVQEREGTAMGGAPAAAPTVDAPGVLPAQGDGGDRSQKLVVEMRHVNPPPGATMHVVEADPSQVDVVGPKVMGAMPTAGTTRNVARDGF